MRSRFVIAAASIAVLGLAAVAGAESGPAKEEIEARVAEVERAFARTMAERDHQAFTRFLSAEAVFLAGPNASRGKQAVADAWKRYFESEEAPFSWQPATVVVLDSGELALSTGPVHDATGKHVSTFTSIWRQEEPGVWRIVFDKGERACD